MGDICDSGDATLAPICDEVTRQSSMIYFTRHEYNNTQRFLTLDLTIGNFLKLFF
jgi:hypothetical protein